MSRDLASRRMRQRGAAILTAMVIVTIVATLSAGMVWQQWRAVRVEAGERARAQAAWILTGALDWARLILREDARTRGADHLGEPWAVPLAESRLSTFLAADRDRQEGAPEAFLSGRIEDAQARYNLRNLINNDKIAEAELETLRRLFQAVQADPGGADRLAKALLQSLAPGPSRNDPALLAPQDAGQLRWLGLDTETLARLRPFIVLLPVTTTVNMNTAPREVIAAVLPGADLTVAERIVQARARSPLRGLDDVQALLPQGMTADPSRVGIATNFFEVHGRLRLEDRVLEERSLVQRRGIDVVALSRERASGSE